MQRFDFTAVLSQKELRLRFKLACDTIRRMVFTCEMSNVIVAEEQLKTVY